ncbi:MAG TPA: class I SAM-dependent methyltransferase [Bryobacteraceae bacterium]|jgi:predicted O-methyltransferase YrrM|nr:class I SAM-dependent methyltransferase [Bryobacteraceae bacterium]
MATGDTTIDDELLDYIGRVTLREPEILRRLRDEISIHPYASMQISAEQGQFMALLVHLLSARKTLEIGVFTGYSSLAVALALPDDGRIIACDISEEWTSIARRYWREAGVERKIDLRLGPALKTLDDLIAQGQGGRFDFAFIDADKGNYINYYERALVLVRPGGLIAVDNVLWDGKVIDPSVNDADTRAIRAFNESLHNDERIWLSMVPIRDGLTLACKK